MNISDPCRGCPRFPQECHSDGCKRWRNYYLERQAMINGYALANFGRPAIDTEELRQNPEKFQDYLRRSPCQNCRAEEHCDTPCAAYLQWWDERMGWVRRKYG